ncbi:MAG: sigma-70 family RNA polymerase sigma factor [Oscillospiraceae bacterium]|nr:sigma-70 family RNA polymerase sigma factor [Oscillospiraceae bacterium]
MLIFYLSMLNTESERSKMIEIYKENNLALLKYALKITNNKAMAEDAVQDTFIAIIKHKEKYFNMNSKDFRISAVIIVRHKCIDLLRKQTPFVETSIEELEIALESGETPVEEQVNCLYEYNSIRKHLNSIDEISQQVLILKYCYSMSYKEIGKQLGMTEKHVDTRIMRAKEKVRKLAQIGVKKNE